MWLKSSFQITNQIIYQITNKLFKETNIKTIFNEFSKSHALYSVKSLNSVVLNPQNASNQSKINFNSTTSSKHETLNRSYATMPSLTKEQFEFFKSQGIEFSSISESDLTPNDYLDDEDDGYNIHFAGIPKQTPLDELEGKIPFDPNYEHDFLNPKYDKSLHLYARVDLSRLAIWGLYRRLLRAAYSFPTIAQRKHCEFEIKNEFRKNKDLKDREELIILVTCAINHEDDMKVLAKNRMQFFSDDREQFGDKSPKGSIETEMEQYPYSEWK